MLRPDWTKIGTRQELQRDIAADFSVAIGWHETNSDTALVTVANAELGLYYVQVWNSPDVRNQIVALLALPVHNDRSPSA